MSDDYGPILEQLREELRVLDAKRSALRAAIVGFEALLVPLDNCDIVPDEGHSQAHAPHCRSYRPNEICKCGRGLYDGHIEASWVRPPTGGATP